MGTRTVTMIQPTLFAALVARVAPLSSASLRSLPAVLRTIDLTAEVPAAHEEHRLTGGTYKLKERDFFFHPKRMKENSTNTPRGHILAGLGFSPDICGGSRSAREKLRLDPPVFFRRLTGLRRLRGKSEFLTTSSSLANFGQISALLSGRLQRQNARNVRGNPYDNFVSLPITFSDNR